MFAKTMMKAMLFSLAVSVGGASFAQSQYGSGDYSAGESRRAVPVATGVVLQVRDVSINVEASGEKKALGGVAGGAVCSLLTARSSLDWSARASLGALCAVGAAQMTNKVGAERRTSTEVIVQMRDGRVLAVTQEAGEPLLAGDRIMLLSGGSADRVVKISAPQPQGEGV